MAAVAPVHRPPGGGGGDRAAHAERTGTAHSRSSALGILEERFARGDIDAEEFEGLRQALRS
ncbi:MAG: SHOCT domain-containing protein [Acidimicrobiia bacterium]